MRRRNSSKAGRAWRPARLFPMALASVCAFLLLSGCSNREALHPALRLEEEDFAQAVKKGRGLIGCDDPYRAYGYGVQQVNLRVTPQVVVREAGCCWPADRVAFALASQQETDDLAVERVAKRARERSEREIMFSVVMRIPKARDPSSITFEMRTSSGHSYPPLAVDTPVYLRDAPDPYDAAQPMLVLYGYDIHFPIQGSPGYPPVGPEVTGLTLVVQDGQNTAEIPFSMPTKVRRY